MAGAINFAMTDIYGGYAGTTETTIPEARDQKALVDDQKASEAVSESGTKKKPILLALAVIVVLALVMGVIKR